MHKLRFRQVHLDFHTSPAIPGIGSSFDRKQWQDTLKAGHVDSITAFAKCHHGWSYHETKVGKMHPHLDFDLLRAQFDASKEIDVNVPIYLSAGLDNCITEEHPEWQEIGFDGRYITGDITHASFHRMCFNSPYLDYLCDQIREVVELFPGCDGIFLDIISQAQCCCNWCLKVMEEHGLDAEKEEDRKQCAAIALDRYYKETTAAAKSNNRDMPIFHNSGHVSPARKDILKYFSHLELESLPTGGWGYDHFPMSAKYCQNLEHDFLGMTGKFHTTWGEFGGYKHPNALRYECDAMIAFGAKCSVGDQLHPDGALDISTYNIIGDAFADVEAKEPWCENAEQVAEIGLFSAESVGEPRDNHTDKGAARVLLENHYLFDIVDKDMDFSKYRVLILPDCISVDSELKAKIDTFLADGGRLLLTGTSGVNEDGTDFLFDTGATYESNGQYQPDFILPREDLRASFVDSPLVMYLPAHRIRVNDGESLGNVYEPYFNRNYRHFCSHQHAPPRPEPSGFDCGVQKGSVIYLAHPAFSLYAGFGAVAYKEYLNNVISLLLDGEPTLETNLPSSGRVTMTRQEQENRSIIHLLYADKITRGSPMQFSGDNIAKGGKSLEIIEDLQPIRDNKLIVRSGHPIEKVSLEPEGRDLPFEQNGNQVKIQLDEFTCHAMIVLHYG